MLEILFREDARPQCLFGWRFTAIEADEDQLAGVERPDAWEKWSSGTGAVTGVGGHVSLTKADLTLLLNQGSKLKGYGSGERLQMLPRMRHERR